LFNQVDIIFSSAFPSHEVTWLDLVISEAAKCRLLRFEISRLINHLALFLVRKDNDTVFGTCKPASAEGVNLQSNIVT
jgi:hypothetical protein